MKKNLDYLNNVIKESRKITWSNYRYTPSKGHYRQHFLRDMDKQDAHFNAKKYENAFNKSNSLKDFGNKADVDIKSNSFADSEFQEVLSKPTSEILRLSIRNVNTDTHEIAVILYLFFLSGMAEITYDSGEPHPIMLDDESVMFTFIDHFDEIKEQAKQAFNISNIDKFNLANVAHKNAIKIARNILGLVDIRNMAISRNNGIHTKLRNIAKKIASDSGVKLNAPDRWNPADIVIHDPSITIPDCKSFEELNKFIADSITTRKLFPISLKNTANARLGSTSIEHELPYKNIKNKETVKKIINDIQSKIKVEFDVDEFIDNHKDYPVGKEILYAINNELENITTHIERALSIQALSSRYYLCNPDKINLVTSKTRAKVTPLSIRFAAGNSTCYLNFNISSESFNGNYYASIRKASRGAKTLRCIIKTGE